MNLRIFDSAGDLVAAAADAVLQRAVEGSVIALSGGNTPAPLYDILGADEGLRERAVTWVEVDERYVPLSDPQSNAAMIERTLFARGIAERQTFLRFQTELGDPAATARAFESEWRRLELPRIDVVILGMGDDGHTASLFPGTNALEVTDRIATEVWVPRLDAWRVTLTAPVIREATLRIVLAAGASKAPVLRRVREGEDLPIGRVTSGVETWWFVDRAAADAG